MKYSKEGQYMAKEKIYISIIATLIIFLIVRVLIQFMAGNAYLVIPGWHTTVYKAPTSLTLFVLIMTGVVTLLFKLVSKTIQTIWTNLTNKTKS